MNFNNVTIMGRLTDVPSLRSVGAKNTTLATFTVAVNEPSRDETSFFDVTMWGKTAENFCKYIKKGAVVLINGRLQQQRWEKDGAKRSKVVVVATNFVFGPPPKDTPASAGPPDDTF
jgi:single-strand DNA-binding protein